MTLLSRRQFNTQCVALGLSLSAMNRALAAATGAASPTAGRTVQFPDGTTVPAIGQGAWHLGQGKHPPAVEEEAMRAGIALGMTLIDTSGNYGGGDSEKCI